MNIMERAKIATQFNDTVKRFFSEYRDYIGQLNDVEIPSNYKLFISSLLSDYEIQLGFHYVKTVVVENAHNGYGGGCESSYDNYDTVKTGYATIPLYLLEMHGVTNTVDEFLILIENNQKLKRNKAKLERIAKLEAEILKIKNEH